MIAVLIVAASVIAANLIKTYGLVMDRYLFKTPQKKPVVLFLSSQDA